MIYSGEQYQDSTRDRQAARDNREGVKDVTLYPQSVVDVPARIYATQHEAETIDAL